MEKLQMKYFVLKPRGEGHHARASRAAMRAYAHELQRHGESVFAAQLIKWADEEADAVEQDT